MEKQKTPEEIHWSAEKLAGQVLVSSLLILGMLIAGYLVEVIETLRFAKLWFWTSVGFVAMSLPVFWLTIKARNLQKSRQKQMANLSRLLDLAQDEREVLPEIWVSIGRIAENK